MMEEIIVHLHFIVYPCSIGCICVLESHWTVRTERILLFSPHMNNELLRRCLDPLVPSTRGLSALRAPSIIPLTFLYDSTSLGLDGSRSSTQPHLSIRKLVQRKSPPVITPSKYCSMSMRAHMPMPATKPVVAREAIR
jgi:hypothetical protein